MCDREESLPHSLSMQMVAPVATSSAGLQSLLRWLLGEIGPPGCIPSVRGNRGWRALLLPILLAGVLIPACAGADEVNPPPPPRNSSHPLAAYEPPPSCTEWFDGCNDCKRVGGGGP